VVHREARRRIGVLNKNQQDMAQQAAKTKTVIDQLCSRRHGLLKQCKVST
jgi:hypothetical protein